MILPVRLFQRAARLCGILCLASGVVPGAVIYENFAPEAPGYSGGGFSIWSIRDPFPLPPLKSGLDLAMHFTVAQDAVVETASLPLRFDQYSNTSVRVSLTEGTIGAPGTVLDSFTLTSDPAVMTLYSGAFSSRPVLVAGNQYWLTVTTESDFASVVWASTHPFFPRDPTRPLGLFAHRSFNKMTSLPEPWYAFLTSVQSAFRLEGEVVGTQVPEPSAFLLAGAGLGFVLYRRKLANQPATTSDSAIAGVALFPLRNCLIERSACRVR